MVGSKFPLFMLETVADPVDIVLSFNIFGDEFASMRLPVKVKLDLASNLLAGGGEMVEANPVFVLLARGGECNTNDQRTFVC